MEGENVVAYGRPTSPARDVSCKKTDVGRIYNCRSILRLNLS